jgi:hypothetical protein
MAGRTDCPHEKRGEGSQSGKKLYCFDFDDTLVYTDSYIRASDGSILSTTRYAKDKPPLDPTDPFGDFRNVETVRLMKGPCYSKFVRAVEEGSPISVVTARDNKTSQFMGLMRRVASLEEGLRLDESRVSLYLCNGDDFVGLLPESCRMDLTARKALALRHFMSLHPDHRSLGFSDDDPKNLESVGRLFVELRREHPEKTFKLYPVEAPTESPFGHPKSEAEVQKLRETRVKGGDSATPLDPPHSVGRDRSRSPAPGRFGLAETPDCGDVETAS